MIALYLSLALAISQADEIRLEDIVSKTSTANYQVLAEAQRVYQAKESVKVARGELLPSLNIWRIIGAIVDPFSLISQDVAPFLVPSNWFRLKQSEKLYNAEKEAYRALWANQVYGAKALYLQILADQQTALMVLSIRTNLGELESLASKRERLGGLEPGVARDLRAKILALDEDTLRFSQVLANELASLRTYIGTDANDELSLAPVFFPDLEREPHLDKVEIQKLALAASPEILQHKEFLEALKSVRGENRFSFLGLASNSRGVAGGIFDSLPISSGLGFATAPSMRIIKAERERLELQLKGLEETIKRDVSSVISQLNIEISSYKLVKERVLIVREFMGLQKKRLEFGQDIEPGAISETYKSLVSAENSLLQAQFRYLVFQERLNRLLMREDYAKAP